jgi:Flp pilus assembly protein TadG
MIVALLLLALIGMLVLVFDLGRVVAIRRDQVNAADAAALAAAQQCALGNTQADARAAATKLNTDNSSGALVSFFDAPQCNGVTSTLTSGTKLVTVDSTVNVEYFFAQIFGLDSGPVTTRAVAQWGPTIAVLNPTPIRISQAGLGSCVAAAEANNVAGCLLGFDNSGTVEADSQWGILNFPQGWPSEDPYANPTDCANNAGGASEDIQYIIPDGDPTNFTAGLEPFEDNDGAAFVCGAPGSLGGDIIDALTARACGTPSATCDPYLTFPVMSDTIPVITTPGQEAFPVIDFAVLRVLGAWKGQDAREHCTFPVTVKDSSLFCIQLVWEADKQLISGIPGSGLSYPGTTKSVRLVQ